jgi:hypothetical protein
LHAQCELDAARPLQEALAQLHELGVEPQVGGHAVARRDHCAERAAVVKRAHQQRSDQPRRRIGPAMRGIALQRVILLHVEHRRGVDGGDGARRADGEHRRAWRGHRRWCRARFEHVQGQRGRRRGRHEAATGDE